jgi:hypothetical protein
LLQNSSVYATLFVAIRLVNSVGCVQKVTQTLAHAGFCVVLLLLAPNRVHRYGLIP